MLGSSPWTNEHVDCVYWRDDDGSYRAKTVTAAAASAIGTDIFEPIFKLTAVLKARRIFND
jgi:hypothetical protein